MIYISTLFPNITIISPEITTRITTRLTAVLLRIVLAVKHNPIGAPNGEKPVLRAYWLVVARLREPPTFS
jgi:hypothetical protein